MDIVTKIFTRFLFLFFFFPQFYLLSLFWDPAFLKCLGVYLLISGWLHTYLHEGIQNSKLIYENTNTQIFRLENIPHLAIFCCRILLAASALSYWYFLIYVPSHQMWLLLFPTVLTTTKLTGIRTSVSHYMLFYFSDIAFWNIVYQSANWGICASGL